MPCTFERPTASAGYRQLAAPRGRAVGQSGSLQAAVGRFSSQASYGLAWLYKKSQVSFDLALKCSVGCIFVNPFSHGDGFARTKIRQSSIKYAGSLGRWDERLTNFIFVKL